MNQYSCFRDLQFDCLQKNYPLFRTIGNYGYILGHKTGDSINAINSLSSVPNIQSFNDLNIFKELIAKDKIFGHFLYISGFNVKELQRVIALHLVSNEGVVRENSYCLQNVIPRRIYSNENWISGIFIGNKSIEENWDFNNYYDTNLGGIVEIRSDYAIPSEVTDEAKKKITVGILINYGARAVLKTEKLDFNEFKDKDMDLPKEPAVSVLLLPGAFVWLEAVVRFRTDGKLDAITTMKDLLSDWFKSDESLNRVPILCFNFNPSYIDWGIQIKPVIEGISEERVVYIEVPNGWKSCLTVLEWNEVNIDSHLYQRNMKPNWQDQVSNSNTSYRQKWIDRTVEINEWIKTNPNYKQDLGSIRRMPTNEYHKEDIIWLYCVESNHTIQLMARFKRSLIKGVDHISNTGPVLVLNGNQEVDKLAFNLMQNHLYGTHLFVIKDPENESKDMKLNVLICGKTDQMLNFTPIEINEVLWREVEKDIWIKGLLIGGIDVIKKKWRNMRRIKTSVDNLSPKIKKPRKKRRSKYDKPVVEIKPETWKLDPNWVNCIEIQSNYILPHLSEDLPFNGQVIGLYIPKGVRCVLINAVIDSELHPEIHSQHQVFYKHSTHPILLQEKCFLWIEGRIEFSLLEDELIAYQPLEYSLLKQLVLEKRIIGDTDGIELTRDLYRKVLFLQPVPNRDILWSIEVSPLIYPFYEHRVLSINIPIGGKIKVQNWDTAFEETIITDHNFAPNSVVDINRNPIKIEPNIRLRKWIEMDFKPKVYKFIKYCTNLEILIEIPANYRRNALRTRKSLETRDKHYVKRYSNMFFLYEHFRDKSVYWIVINYKNLYLDHSGLMKMHKNKISMFEMQFKKTFYNQLI